MNEEIVKICPIAFICDDKFAIPTITAITSLLNSKEDDTKYKIYVCTETLSKENTDLFNKFKNEPWNCELIILNFSIEQFKDIYIDTESGTGAGSIVALIKFILSDFIDEDILLYLDSDILVKKDLSNLFDEFQIEKIAGVVLDTGKIYNKGGLREELPKYFNSGVMMLNLARMREESYSKKLIETKKSFDDFTLVDQDAFNLVFRGDVYLLKVEYNLLIRNLIDSAHKYSMEALNVFCNTSYSCLHSMEEDASILHFASPKKPWLDLNSRHGLLWKKISNLSPLFVETDKTSIEIKTTIPIILATDEGYAKQTHVTIISVLENSSIEVYYDIYVLVPERFSNETEIEFFNIKKVYTNCNINFIEMAEEYVDAKLNIPHITSPTFYRLSAPELFPQYDKIIYLDSDVIVETDLIDYFETDLTSFYLSGVKAPSYHAAKDDNRIYCEANELPAIDNYINAGVILMNLRLMREHNLTPRFKELSTRGFRSQDQDILNGVCYGKILHLHYKYNCMITKYENQESQLRVVFSDEIIKYAHNFPSIIHYAAENKPWEDYLCALSDRWWKYAKLSSFYNLIILEYSEKAIFSTQQKKLDLVRQVKKANSRPCQSTYQCSFLVKEFGKFIKSSNVLDNMRSDSKAINQIKGQLRWTRNEIEKLRAERLGLKKELNCYKKIQFSFSYKLGRAITWLPRNIKNIVNKY